MNRKSILQNTFVSLIFASATAISAFAQTTTFTYQGKLSDTGTPQANYQMRFELYDALMDGNQVGPTMTNPSVSVTQGAFTVQLDFGGAAFDGTDRFLEIAIRRNEGDPFTVLNPRQQIRSTPYSARALNAGQADLALDANKLGGIDASEYVTTIGAGNAFVNNTTTPQSGNFNISGVGVVGDSLGVGTTPNSGYKFDVSGNSRITTASGAVITFASPNSESGMSTAFNGGRADIRFDGSTIKLVAGLPGGPPSSTNGLSVSTAGNVGIGTTNPRAKLDVAGNAVQDRDKSGMPKAMLYVDGIQLNPSILRCYNGITGASTGTCGFTVTRNSDGSYDVGLGFQVSDRFVSVTAQLGAPIFIGGSSINFGANFSFNSQNNTTLTVVTFYSAISENKKDGRFTLLVY